MNGIINLNSDTLPDNVDQEHSVDPRAIKVWRWSVLGHSLFVIFLFLVGALFLLLNYRYLWPVAAAICAVILPVLILTTLRYPKAYYRHLRYRVDDEGIRIQKGVFWRTLSFLPRVRIQHSDVSQGPLQRRHGVSTLKLYTAGSQFTKIELDGLEYDTAMALRNQLQRNETDDAV